jgi:hypothetical protein
MSPALTLQRLQFGVQSWLYVVVLIAAPIAVFGPGMAKWWNRPASYPALRNKVIIIYGDEEPPNVHGRY